MKNKYVQMLGMHGTDMVTGFRGTITSVCFDLYGCIQFILTPKSKEDKIPDSSWFDANRVLVSATKPRVMDAPDFENQSIAKAEKGCAIKPLP